MKRETLKALIERIPSMVDLCENEANRIETSQSAMIRAGIRKVSDQGYVSRANGFRQASRLLLEFERRSDVLLEFMTKANAK